MSGLTNNGALQVIDDFSSEQYNDLETKQYVDMINRYMDNKDSDSSQSILEKSIQIKALDK